MAYAFNSTASKGSGESSGDPTDYFEYGVEEQVGYDPVPGSMPEETAEALRGVLESPLGNKIHSHVQRFGKFSLVRSADPGSAFQVASGGDIIYHQNISAWKAARGYSGPSQTLGSLLSHEIGHAIHMDLGIKNQPGFLRFQAEEVTTVRNFENVYRRHHGMPERCTRFFSGDSC